MIVVSAVTVLLRAVLAPLLLAVEIIHPARMTETVETVTATATEIANMIEITTTVGALVVPATVIVK